MLELIAGLDFPKKVVRLAKTACVVETSAWQVHMDVAEPWKCGGMQVHHNLNKATNYAAELTKPILHESSVYPCMNEPMQFQRLPDHRYYKSRI